MLNSIFGVRLIMVEDSFSLVKNLLFCLHCVVVLLNCHQELDGLLLICPYCLLKLGTIFFLRVALYCLNFVFESHGIDNHIKQRVFLLSYWGPLVAIKQRIRELNHESTCTMFIECNYVRPL